MTDQEVIEKLNELRDWTGGYEEALARAVEVLEGLDKLKIELKEGLKRRITP